MPSRVAIRSIWTKTAIEWITAGGQRQHGGHVIVNLHHKRCSLRTGDMSCSSVGVVPQKRKR